MIDKKEHKKRAAEIDDLKTAFEELGQAIENETVTFNDLMLLLSQYERALIKFRNNVVASADNETEIRKLTNCIIDSNEITISISNDGIIRITIPIIVPFKKLKSLRQKPSFLDDENCDTYDLKGVIERANAIRFPLECALLKRKADGCFNKFDYKKAILVYCNNYPEVKKSDVDNFEYKQISDTIMGVLNHGDDNGISIMLTSRYDAKYHTDITIYPSNFKYEFKTSK